MFPPAKLELKIAKNSTTAALHLLQNILKQLQEQVLHSAESTT
jgi:hypothetical protein